MYFPQGDGKWIYRHQTGHDLGMGIESCFEVACSLVKGEIWHGSITKAMKWATLLPITPWTQIVLHSFTSTATEHNSQ